MIDSSEYAILFIDGLTKYITAQYFDVTDSGVLVFYRNDDSVPFAAINSDRWSEVAEYIKNDGAENV